MPLLLHVTSRLRSLLLGAAMVALVTGCGDGDALAGPESTVVGTYSLASLNGTPVPVTLSRRGTTESRLTSGVLQLTPGGDFTQVLVNTEHDTDGVQRRSTALSIGRYSRSGSVITLTDASSGARTSGLFASGELNLTAGSDILRFRR